jgi:hypothetical protein
MKSIYIENEIGLNFLNLILIDSQIDSNFIIYDKLEKLLQIDLIRPDFLRTELKKIFFFKYTIVFETYSRIIFRNVNEYNIISNELIDLKNQYYSIESIEFNIKQSKILINSNFNLIEINIGKININLIDIEERDNNYLRIYDWKNFKYIKEKIKKYQLIK